MEGLLGKLEENGSNEAPRDGRAEPQPLRDPASGSSHVLKKILKREEASPDESVIKGVRAAASEGDVGNDLVSLKDTRSAGRSSATGCTLAPSFIPPSPLLLLSVAL